MSAGALQGQIDQIVADSMGVYLIPGHRSRLPKTPASAALLAFMVMSLVFALPSWLSEQRQWTTVGSLSIWGALYFGWAVFTARLATSSVKSMLCNELQPLLSESQKDYVCNSLKTRFSRRRILSASLVVAVLATGASVIALSASKLSDFQLALIASEFFLLYVTGAQATYAACFYGVFAEAIEIEPQTLGPLIPFASPAVQAMRSIGAVVLLFWFGIMISVLTLMIFSSTLKSFVLIVVPIASFFSFMFGSAVFIAAESTLRRACRRAAVDVRLKLNAEARDLISKLGQPGDTSALDRLEKLTKIGSAVAPVDSKGILLVILSIVTPFAGPVVALVIHFLGKS